MAKSKYFPDLTNGESVADVEQIETAFALVEKDMENAGEKADQTFSSTSKNAQSGVAIAKELEKYQKTLTFDTTPTQGSTNPVTSDGVNESLNDLEAYIKKWLDDYYVVKAANKGLSTNDYTDAEKQKNADNESHIGKLSELSDRMYSSTPESLVNAINTMVDAVRNKADVDYVGVQKIENLNAEAYPWSWTYLGLYYFKGKFSLPTSQGSYTYTFDNLVYVKNDGLQNYQLTVYEQTGITILTFGNDSTEIEKKTYSYDQFITATDYATRDTAGTVVIRSENGVYINSKGVVVTVGATADEIAARNSIYHLITPSNLNAAVKAALTDSKHISDMTAADRECACNVIGAEQETILSYPVTSDITLNDKTDIRVPSNTTTINLILPSTISGLYECAFTFQSGDTATSLTYEGDTFKFVGVDCDENGDFIPTANKNYEVAIKNLSTLIGNTVLVARVGVY